MFEQGSFQIPADIPPEMAEKMIAERRKRLKEGRANYGSARYVGEGIGHALNGAFVGMGNSRIDKRENDLAKMIMERARQKNMPAYQNGTMYHPGGTALVGEQGPEVVTMPQGAQVLPFDDPALVGMFQSLPPEQQAAALAKIQQGYTPDEAVAPQGWSNPGMIAPEMVPQQSPQAAMVQGGAGVFGMGGGEGDDALKSDAVPSPQELAELAAAAGFDPESLRGMNLNATEARNLGLTLRMMQAESTLRPIQDLGTNFKERALEWIPGQTVENAIYGAGALGTDPRYQQYMNARDSFANAALRADTGATINESELPAIIKESMPLPGDSDETIALKQRTREARIRALIAGTGPASAVLPQPGQPIIPQAEMSDDEFLKSLGLN